MEYIYGAMLLHKAGKKVNEESLKKILEAAGVKVDEARVKALVAALEGINIDEVIEKAAIPVASAEVKAEKKEEAKEEAKEEKKSSEEAAAGLGSLFG